MTQDVKVTLSFDADVVERAKAFAASQGISLSRLTEFLFDKITSAPRPYKNLEDIPLADFIRMVAEPEVTYEKPRNLKKEYFESKK
ncbi:DUF6364 family protein [Leadbetterella sp. DM7]|uniref:DUF6364 family protein n=1 Tax=Leadbetterella sp. DM7 TaxID=3235085 RepID=UPI00349E70E7